ncbi:hypothetical protein [Poriferisphaera sp. WC338]|uniref:hypothetical protein n=1 Tax=Poriferisphaera sp. WC338 TaxID=3425129 RepID=UPI003D815152
MSISSSTSPRITTSLLAIMLALFSGCTTASLPSLPVVSGPGAKIDVTSQTHPEASRSFKFDQALYNVDDNSDVTILLIQGTAENPTAVLTARMFWTPIPAQTPIDQTATNATFHLALYNDQPDGSKACAVYAGAGFLYLYNNAGKSKLSAGIWEANLRLADATTNHKNVYDKSKLDGKIIALKNSTLLSENLATINQITAQYLGYPRFMMNPSSPFITPPSDQQLARSY